jgi:DnaK suppressor protein
MEHLTPEQLGSLRAQLQAMREAVLEQLEVGQRESQDPLAPDVGDRQDMAVGEKDHHRAKQLIGRGRAQLAEVDAALARMEDGSYGLCEDTDDPIPYARLAAAPTTRYSVGALELREARGERVRSPEEDEAY